jgi:hypothetical protein
MDAALEALLNDTQAQLDAAFDAVNAGALVDLGDLPPRIEEICMRAVASGKPDAADRLRILIERLDALELSLRALMTTAQGMEPQLHSAGRRHAAATYRNTAETTGGAAAAGTTGGGDE